VTPQPSAETLRLLRSTVAPMLAEVYPQFAARVFGAVRVPENGTVQFCRPDTGAGGKHRTRKYDR
jgi:hypothetical protein